MNIKKKNEKDNGLISLSDDRIREIMADWEEQLPAAETLSIGTIKRYCRICAEEEGSDSDKAKEYQPYIALTLRNLSREDRSIERVFKTEDGHAFTTEMIGFPQIQSLDEDLAQCLSPIRCCLRLPNVEEISHDCLELLFSRNNKIQLHHKFKQYHCLEIGLTNMDKTQAAVVGRYDGHLSLPKLEAIDADAAKKLRGIAWNLRLGVTQLDVETAQALVDLPKKSQGRILHLYQLKSASADVLKVLCENEGLIFLGFEDVSTEQMVILTQRENRFLLPQLRHISLEGLELFVGFLSNHSGIWGTDSLDLKCIASLSADEAKILANTKQTNLHLEGLKSITADVAKALSSFRGSLFLSGISDLDTDSAAHLANLQKKGYEHYLDLSGLKKLDVDTAESLARYGGAINLSGLSVLTEDVAQALGKSDANRLYLDGLTSVSAAAAEAISGSQEWLYLNGLTEISDATAKSLAKHKGGLQLQGISSLSDAAAKALRKHEGAVFFANQSALLE